MLPIVTFLQAGPNVLPWALGVLPLSNLYSFALQVLSFHLILFPFKQICGLPFLITNKMGTQNLSLVLLFIRQYPISYQTNPYHPSIQPFSRLSIPVFNYIHPSNIKSDFFYTLYYWAPQNQENQLRQTTWLSCNTLGPLPFYQDGRVLQLPK